MNLVIGIWMKRSPGMYSPKDAGTPRPKCMETVRPKSMGTCRLKGADNEAWGKAPGVAAYIGPSPERARQRIPENGSFITPFQGCGSLARPSPGALRRALLSAPFRSEFCVLTRYPGWTRVRSEELEVEPGLTRYLHVMPYRINEPSL